MIDTCDCGHAWTKHDASGCWYEYDHGAGIECECAKAPPTFDWTEAAADMSEYVGGLKRVYRNIMKDKAKTTPHARATAQDVIDHFRAIEPMKAINCNWGTDAERPSIWDLQHTTSYINGVMIIMDFDFEMAYLLEVCDRDEANGQTWVRHLMIYMGIKGDTWKWCEHRAYPFFDRSVTALSLHIEFINWVDTMKDEWRKKS